MASSISGARTALYDALAAAAWPAPAPQVAFGEPASEKRTVVALMGVRDPSEQEAAIGAQSKDETFVLEVGVKVHDPGAATAQQVDARGFALADVVRSVVRANSGFAPGTLVPAKVISQTTDGALLAVGEQPGSTAGWVIFLTVLVQCKTRTTA